MVNISRRASYKLFYEISKKRMDLVLILLLGILFGDSMISSTSEPQLLLAAKSDHACNGRKLVGVYVTKLEKCLKFPTYHHPILFLRHLALNWIFQHLHIVAPAHSLTNVKGGQPDKIRLLVFYSSC